MLVSQCKKADGQPLALPGAIEEFAAHAVESYPNECVGFFDTDGIYHKLQNLSVEPTKHAVPPAKVVASLLANDKIAALCHSHPDGPDCPSELDMRSQEEMYLPYSIIATNGQACAKPFVWGDTLVDDRPILGRPFRHGVNDCYDLLRALFLRSHEILLPQFARGWEWWLPSYEGETDLYRRGFAEAGFNEVSQTDPKPGDVWLAAVRSKVPNHAGVYLGDGLCVHHPSSGLAYDPVRVSKREPVVRWVPYITHWLRREDIAANCPSSWPLGEKVRQKT